MFTYLRTQHIRHIIGFTMLSSACLLAMPQQSWSAEAEDGGFTDTLSLQPPTPPPPAASETDATLKDNLPANTPAYFRKTYLSLMRAPLPAKIYNQGGIPRFVPQFEIDADPLGKIGTYQPSGAVETAKNAFFQALGTNGRSCATCHQPPSGMSVSVRNIQRRLAATGGRDPIFAPVDGANCPNQVTATETSGSLLGARKGKGMKAFKDAHSLLLNKGLIRIALPVPGNAEFTINVVSDPTTCNTDPDYNSLADGTKIVSVFRRPAISSNLNFKNITLSPGPGGNSGNVMWDGREPTLFTQSVSATLGHAQALSPPTQEQQNQIVQFETKIFNAQYSDNQAGLLNAAFATGGPKVLSGIPPGQAAFLANPPVTFNEYDAWVTASGNKAAAQKSIERGQRIFNQKSFTISNVAGFNDAFGGGPVVANCAICHNVVGAGSDILPESQRDIGVAGQAQAFNGAAPATDLPQFKVTCNIDDGTTAGVDANGFLFFGAGSSVVTNDPGKALITGKCKDVGARTVPSLRGLASHEPFFSDGSAANLDQVVKFYNKRFSIGLSAQEQTDLIHFLGAL
ncbi:MAG: hypothetical protein ACXV8Q_19845 [Methylobacter sp.]